MEPSQYLAIIGIWVLFIGIFYFCAYDEMKELLASFFGDHSIENDDEVLEEDRQRR